MLSSWEKGVRCGIPQPLFIYTIEQCASENGISHCIDTILKYGGCTDLIQPLSLFKIDSKEYLFELLMKIECKKGYQYIANKGSYAGVKESILSDVDLLMSILYFDGNESFIIKKSSFSELITSILEQYVGTSLLSADDVNVLLKKYKFFDSKVQTVQRVLLQLLKETDDICSENGIFYSIGPKMKVNCERFGGFSPWDINASIVMFRKDWKRFKECAAGRTVDCIDFGFKRTIVHRIAPPSIPGSWAYLNVILIECVPGDDTSRYEAVRANLAENLMALDAKRIKAINDPAVMSAYHGYFEQLSQEDVHSSYCCIGADRRPKSVNLFETRRIESTQIIDYDGVPLKTSAAVSEMVAETDMEKHQSMEVKVPSVDRRIDYERLAGCLSGNKSGVI
jgi:hypothetical protein